MSSLEYSIEALNVKNAFYKVKTMVYVEGEDDVMFWDVMFSKIPGFKYKIEAVGGCPELDKHISNIEAGVLNAIAARDSDFIRFTGRISSNPRAIYTFGYAIENSLYTSEILHQITRSWCKSSAVTEADCVQWLNDIAAAFMPLVALDIANAISRSGVSVLKDNCARFMASQTSATPSIEKIAAHAIDIAAKLPKKSITAAHAALAFSPSASLDYFRGHMLATAVSKFLIQVAKRLKKKITVSSDALYAIAISHFARLFSSTHPHYVYYTTATATAATTFT